MNFLKSQFFLILSSVDYVQWQYVPVSRTGSVTFDGVSDRSTAVSFQYMLADNNEAHGLVSSLINSTASLTIDSRYIDGNSVAVHVVTSPYHSTSDWIGLYTPGSCPDNTCELQWAYVPAGNVSTIVISVPSTKGPLEARYLLSSYERLATSGLSSYVAKIGFCDPSCGNAGTYCESDSTCTSCTGSDFCVSTQLLDWDYLNVPDMYEVGVFPGNMTATIFH